MIKATLTIIMFLSSLCNAMICIPILMGHYSPNGVALVSGIVAVLQFLALLIFQWMLRP